MAYKGVFFDLYGTLLIYGDMTAAWADWLSALHKGMVDCGLSISKDALAETCDSFFSNPTPPRKDGLTPYEGRICKLGGELGLKLGHKDIRHLAQTSIDAWQKYVSLDPETIPLLQTLASRKQLALISNFEHPPHVYSLLAELDLTPFFDIIVVSGDVEVEKPDPRIFAPALQQTQLQPNEVIYVGDTQDDVRGARAAGLTPILIQRDGSNQSQVASDYRPNQQTSPDASDGIPTAGAQVIRKLSELVEIAR